MFNRGGKSCQAGWKRDDWNQTGAGFGVKLKWTWTENWSHPEVGEFNRGSPSQHHGVLVGEPLSKAGCQETGKKNKFQVFAWLCSKADSDWLLRSPRRRRGMRCCPACAAAWPGPWCGRPCPGPAAAGKPGGWTGRAPGGTRCRSRPCRRGRSGRCRTGWRTLEGRRGTSSCYDQLHVIKNKR